MRTDVVRSVEGLKGWIRSIGVACGIWCEPLLCSLLLAHTARTTRGFFPIRQPSSYCAWTLSYRRVTTPVSRIWILERSLSRVSGTTSCGETTFTALLACLSACSYRTLTWSSFWPLSECSMCQHLFKDKVTSHSEGSLQSSTGISLSSKLTLCCFIMTIAFLSTHLEQSQVKGATQLSRTHIFQGCYFSRAATVSPTNTSSYS